MTAATGCLTLVLALGSIPAFGAEASPSGSPPSSGFDPYQQTI